MCRAATFHKCLQNLGDRGVKPKAKDHDDALVGVVFVQLGQRGNVLTQVLVNLRAAVHRGRKEGGGGGRGRGLRRRSSWRCQRATMKLARKLQGVGEGEKQCSMDTPQLF